MRTVLEPEFKLKGGDFFAGGGGVTVAMREIPGLETKWILNHDPQAIKTNSFNNPAVKCYWADFYKQDEKQMEPVDFVWASIECTMHSRARGGKAKKIGSYMLGWEFIRYVRFLQPYVIGIENVPEFKEWSPIRICEDIANSTKKYSALMVDEEGHYVVEEIESRKGEEFEKWKKAIEDMGYNYEERIFNAADHGIPTRRVRFFCFFVKKSLQMQIPWAPLTHNKFGTNGLKKWNACKPYINLQKEGNSIFGREYNPMVPKGKRKPLCINTLKRISGGIKKIHPEMYMLMQYYGSGINAQGLDAPLNSIRTKDCHALLKIEKLRFVQDYCRGDIFHKLEDPMAPQLTWQTKHLVTIEKKQMIADYYSRDDTATSLDAPANSIRTENSKHLLTVDFVSDGTFSTEDKNQSLNEPISTLTSQQRHQMVQAEINFISIQNNSNGNPGANNHSAEEPLWAITNTEKMQFISAYFNSDGNQGSQNQDLESPLGSILTGTNKKALITALKNGEIDFDIKMRFLDPEELSKISTFPDGYFTNPRLKLSKKAATKLIGNAVPPEWARLIIQPVITELRRILKTKRQAA